MLYEFVTTNREEIIARCRTKVATRLVPVRTKPKIDHGVPVFLDQLIAELRIGLSDNPAISYAAIHHGHDLWLQGLTVSQVVHEYGDVCQSITEMAVERDAPIGTDDFRMLNRCLDDAIAGAVTEYERGQDRVQAIDGKSTDQTESLVLAREVLNSIQIATVALEVIKSGRVGIGGSTGTVLDRSLLAAHQFMERLFSELTPPVAPPSPRR
jgi:hypothetical protein